MILGSSTKKNTREKGNDGEDAVCSWYTDRNYVILARNWRYKRLGEIDIILENSEGDVIVCEVKLRKNNAYGAPSSAVDFKKQQRIRKLTEIYILQNPVLLGRNVRFDVGEVVNGEINVLENAF